MAMKSTLVINAKGGVGKTTITTNLASYFAAKGVSTAVLDYDPQGSSLHWLRQRPLHMAKIHGANGAPQKTGLRTVQMHVPPGIEQLIIDAPAGASGMLLHEMLLRAHSILIPVAPSAIDIHATANFIRDLLLKTLSLNDEYDVDVAPDGRTALERMRLYPYDLLIADLKMPGMDGLTVIREARRYKADLRVIIITGFSTESSAIEAVNLGVAGYLTKPFRVPQVLAAAAKALGE